MRLVCINRGLPCVCVLLLLYVKLSHNVVYNYMYAKRSHTYAEDPVVHVRQSSVEYGNTQHALKVSDSVFIL